MPSSYTTSLRLTLPATGELAGQWGNTVNTGITELLDSAVAGTASISTWGGAGVAYTLSNNSGAADEARKMFIVASGSPGEAKNVICPAVSKFYVFRNDTTGGFALTLKTSGGTGIAVPAGQYKFLYCDGTNVVEMFNSAGALTLSGALTVGGTATFSSNPTFSAGTANQVQYLNGSKVLSGSANLTFDGTALTLGGNPTLSAGTANGVTYLNGSKVLTSGSVLTFDGTVLGTTTLDATNVEVTNIKAKDGTASASIADTTGVMSLVANPVFSGGTANGVLYLNGSKVATSGSALTFDGQTLTNTRDTPILNLNDTAASNVALRLLSTGGITYIQSGISAGAFAPIAFTANGGGSEQMRLTSTGLGIGTSSPATKLDVIGTGLVSSFGSNTVAETYVQVKNGTSTLYLGGSSAYNYVYSTASVPLTFWTNSNERMRLDSSGNLGLGVTPSAWGSGTRGFNIGSGSAIWNPGSGNQTHILTNAYNDGTNYIYRNSSNASRYSMVGDAHQWHIAPSGTAGNTISFTQAMTLDASGRLSIGTTSTTKILEVQGSVGYLATFRNNSSTATTSYINVINANNVNAGLVMAHIDDGTGYFGTQNNAALRFVTNDTERARITSGGDFVVNGTSTLNTNAKLSVWNGSSAGSALGIATGYSTTNGQFRLIYLSSTADALSFDNGNNNATLTSGGTWTNASDARLKKNIQPIKYGLETVLASQPKSFNRVDVDGEYIGFIAQELQTQIPEVVYGNEDTKYSVDYGSLVAVAFKAIQEQQALITALTARVAALEAKP